MGFRTASKPTLLADAAAALVTSGAASTAQAEHHEKGEDKVKCEGANGCKGQSACATDHSKCSGLNSCSGKGWVYLSAEECKEAKASMDEEK